MVAPHLDTEHPGIRVIAEVAAVLQAGSASGVALRGVVGALRRGLNLRRCRLWLRTPDGTRYAPVTTPGDEAELPAYSPPVSDWVRQGVQREGTAGGSVLRLPLIHEDEPLGALEVIIPSGRYEGVAHDVVVVVARILAPMIAATELSQDLASEVALRTHEMEAQRSFAAQIIDSLPVGLYVIDRGYRIRAWNRQLAAGVMHEINNPLATILACCEALALRSEDLAPPERQAHQEYLKIVDAEVQRCRRIVDSLLDFSRSRSGDKRQVDVNAVVEQTLFLLKHHARFKRLTVTRELAPGLPAVLADQEKLIQSFMALMLNAMDAMDSRGTLTVRSRINPDRADEILLEFIDTGTGIKREDLPKIFEPFFTTKPQGRGTGLGLSICYGIIAEHRGRIEVESQVGVASNFKVYLPVE